MLTLDLQVEPYWLPSAWSDNVDVPLGETAERYEVEVMNGGAL